MDGKLFKKLQLLCLMLCLATGLSAQHVVSGQVLSTEDNQPLIGVNVIVDGSTKGVTTNLDGRYTINVKDEDVLVFSYIGYISKKMKVGAQTIINLSMVPELQNLDEVVVLGYSTQKKAELSSSVVNLKSKELTNVTTPDLGNMLQGKAAGVVVYNTSGQPGSQATIRIRGTGSITASSDPLYVVDGIIGGSFSPNDVESITVLKDAGATAIYGSEGAGGVIVVTTKSAKKGQKTSVNFKSSAGTKHVLQGRLKMMDSKELYETQKLYMSETLFNSQRPESLLNQNYDWVDATFKKGVVLNNYISISGSSEKTNYFVSFDNYNEDGTLINTKFNRSTARVNLNTQLYKNLTMNTRIAYTNSRDYSPSTYKTLEFSYGMLPWDNPYNEDGSVVDLLNTNAPWLSQERYNIFHAEQYNYAKSHGNDLVADLQFIWQLTPWLTFTTSNRYNTTNSKYVSFIDPRTESSATGSLTNSLSEGWGISTSNILKASFSKNEHDFSGLVGYEYGINKSEYTDASGNKMIDGMDALNACQPTSVGGYEVWGEGWSVLAQVQYSYAHKYILTGSYRADASSKFAPEKRVGHFPSASLAWVINKEEWLKNVDFINQLKLRASYGLTGNSAIGSYLYLDSYTLSSKYNGSAVARPIRKANPYLSWETAHMTNLGIDLGLWKVIDFTVDVYNIENKDLLLNVPTAPSTGFFSQTENAGCVRNRGIDLMLTTRQISNKNFQWFTTFNFGLNRNKVTETPKPEGFLQSNSYGKVTQQVKVGQDIYSWYLPKWLGVDPSNGDPVWEKIIYDENGNISAKEPTTNYDEATIQVVGSATPKFTGGFVNNFRLYGFSLDVACNFVRGNKIFNNDRLLFDNDGAYNTYNLLSLDNGLKWKRWQQEGDVATHPKPVAFGNKNSNEASSRFLEDGSYFRIKNITLAYDFPKELLKKIHFQSLRLQFSTDNVATFTKFSGMDPEVNLQGDEYTLGGMYSTPYPVGRTYMFGINLTF